jgi:hypothetical protein
MATPLQPEFFLLLGIDLFLAISLLSCLLDKHLPWQLPYLYQVASLAGFGQLIVAKEFMALFDGYMRFWFSLLYLVIALANIIAVNAYLGVIKKLGNYAKAFLLAVTFPSFSVATFFLASYSNVSTHPMAIMPQFSWEATFIGIVALDALVIGFGTYLFFKPKWWYIAIGAGAGITGAAIYALYNPSVGSGVFVTSAIALAISCTLVLAVSLYILVRIWKETLREKNRKRR